MAETYPFFKPDADGNMTAEPAEFVVRHVESKKFTLDERFGYKDDKCKHPFVANLDFDTDLSSVPKIFRWLVPKRRSPPAGVVATRCADRR